MSLRFKTWNATFWKMIFVETTIMKNLELWQFLFIRDWPEIWKSDIPPFEFCLISGDLGKLGTPNLPRMSLIKLFRILQSTRVKAFTFSELLRENQRWVKLLTTQISGFNFMLRLKCLHVFWRLSSFFLKKKVGLVIFFFS